VHQNASVVSVARTIDLQRRRFIPMNPRQLAPLTAGALLVVMGLLAGGAALRESVTYDEVLNVGAGVSYWQKLDLRLSEEHPPLARVIAAFPLILRGVRADYSNIAWTISDRLFPAYAGQLYFGELILEHWNDPRTTLALARLPMLFLTLLLGCIVYFYARTIGGPWGALLSTAIYATSPLFLAHGAFVLTDVPIAAFTVLTLFTTASLWRSPGRASGILFGLSLAGALLTKFSALVLLPALAAFVLSLWLRPLSDASPKLPQRRFPAALLGIGITLLAVYAFYLVFSWNQSTSVLSDLNSGPVLRRLLMPPWLYLRGLFLVSLSSSRPTYLLGHSYPQGVWFYFPVLLWLKSPLGFLVLLPTASAVAFLGKARAIPDTAAANWRLLWIAFAAFTAVCLASNLDIGFRHFSVPLVLLILMLAPLPRMVADLRLSAPKAARAITVLIVACAAQCLAVAVAAYPFYLTYANAFGSLKPHYELFNDSNLDWDQSLPEVERFVVQHGIRTIALDHYGYTDAAVSVPQSHIWNCESPTAADAGQWVAVSANLISNVRNCRWLLQYPYEALGGGSMYVVRLPEILPARQAVRTGFMRTSDGGDARQLFIDFIRDPAIVESSAADADRTLTQWSADLLKDHPWLQRHVARRQKVGQVGNVGNLPHMKETQQQIRISADLLIRVAVFAEDAPERVRNLADRRVSLRRGENWRHQVFAAACGCLHLNQALLPLRGIAALPHLLQTFHLRPFVRRVDPKERRVALLLHPESIHAYDNPLVVLNFLLEFESRVLDLTLNESRLNGP
jgi:hypothetical protein